MSKLMSRLMCRSSNKTPTNRDLPTYKSNQSRRKHCFTSGLTFKCERQGSDTGDTVDKKRRQSNT